MAPWKRQQQQAYRPLFVTAQLFGCVFIIGKTPKRGLPNWCRVSCVCCVVPIIYRVSDIFWFFLELSYISSDPRYLLLGGGFWHCCHCAAAGPAAEIPASWKIGQIFCICWLFSYDWTPQTWHPFFVTPFLPYAYAEKPIIWFHAAMNIQTLNQKSIGPMCTKKEEKTNFLVLFLRNLMKGNWFWLERFFSKSPSTYLHSLSKLFCFALIFFLNQSSYANEVNDVTSLSLKTSDTLT